MVIVVLLNLNWLPSILNIALHKQLGRVLVLQVLLDWEVQVHLGLLKNLINKTVKSFSNAVSFIHLCRDFEELKLLFLAKSHSLFGGNSLIIQITFVTQQKHAHVVQITISQYLANSHCDIVESLTTSYVVDQDYTLAVFEVEGIKGLELFLSSSVPESNHERLVFLGETLNEVIHT